MLNLRKEGVSSQQRELKGVKSGRDMKQEIKQGHVKSRKTLSTLEQLIERGGSESKRTTDWQNKSVSTVCAGPPYLAGVVNIERTRRKV